MKHCVDCQFCKWPVGKEPCGHCSNISGNSVAKDGKPRTDNWQLRQAKPNRTTAAPPHQRIANLEADNLALQAENDKLRKALGEFITAACPENQEVYTGDECKQYTTASGCNDCTERQVQKILERPDE